MHRKTFLLVIFTCILLISTPLYSMDLELFLAPDGGFSEYNHHRVIKMKNGKKVRATLNNGLLDMVERVPRGGAIKIVMYNFSYPPLYKLLIKKAMRENVQVKVLLDGCAGWTKDNVADFIKGVKKAAKKAKKRGRKFDYQIKIATRKYMSLHKRTRILDDGKEIFGTMHEKFGIMYDNKNGDPVHSFAGSSNISPGADQVFAENRIFFKNAPVVSQAWANQFARLWNLYSETRTEYATPEFVKPLKGKLPFEIICNGEHIGDLADRNYKRIDTRIMSLLDEVKPDGSVDIMMFSFTHWGIKEKIIEVARKNPGAKFRLLFDHSMLTVNEDRKGLMPPLIEEAIKKYNLKNIEIRFKFRANAYGYSKEKKLIEMDHFRSPLLHDKLMIVNKEKMIFGSYNWSASAEKRNFEDVMIFNVNTDFGKDVITRFLYEFDFLWNRLYDNKPKGSNIDAYVATGKYAREQEKIIVDALSDYNASKLRYLLDRFGPMTIYQLKKKARFKRKGQFARGIARLFHASLITMKMKNGKSYFQLSD